MIELQCPRCLKIKRLDDANPEELTGELREQWDQGKWPLTIICFICWLADQPPDADLRV